ncbi:MAG TPA: hypothetical protein VI564_08805 [Candidatus Nanoarchaeia archaeon]|nr:hypothetical protein [Candidatus Nanoarchaeia archaeon]
MGNLKAAASGKQLFELLKRELLYLAACALIIIALFKIAFFNESLISTIKTAISVFWLFMIPGYFIMLYWNQKLGFTERLVIGTIMGAALIGVMSYYFGLLGVNIKFHSLFLPIAVILISLALNLLGIRKV